MTDRLTEAEAWLAILDAGSVAAGAQRLGLTPSAASRLLARLESRLGARLAQRTTRSFRPTREGVAFAQEARLALDRLAAAEAQVRGAGASRSGLLRVNASVPYALHYIIPKLPEFRARHPEIHLRLSLTDRVVDLAAEGAEVAVRVGALRSVAGLRARLIHEEGLLVVAAPSYRRTRGEPAKPADLRHHDRLDFDLPRARTGWSFNVGGRPVIVATEAILRTDAGEGLRAMALAGLGIARLAEFHVAGDLASGRLIEVLRPYNSGERVKVHALSSVDHGIAAAARVRAFVDFLALASAPSRPRR